MYRAEFADVYDLLMDDVDYPAWARHYARLAGLKGGDTVCECGCGTGSMSVELQKLNLNVIGIDLSEGMLRLASDKARRFGVRCAFACQDMCAFTLHKGVDAVIAPCDGVNYLLDEARVGAFFASAYRALKPGGRLAFDVSTADKLKKLTEAPYYEDREGVSYFWVSERDGPLVHMSLTFFLRQPGGLYKRFDERQSQRIHRLDDLFIALQKAGFFDIAAFGAMTLDAPRPGDDRWHIAATKPATSTKE